MWEEEYNPFADDSEEEADYDDEETAVAPAPAAAPVAAKAQVGSASFSVVFRQPGFPVFWQTSVRIFRTVATSNYYRGV